MRPKGTRGLRMGVRRVLSVFALMAGVIVVAGAARSAMLEKATPPIGEFVSIDDQRLHLLDLGPKDSALPPVVLIHGASANLRDMKIALGDALAADRRVIMVDRPGRGYSTRPRGGWRLDAQARLIRDAVKTLGVENPIILGQSFGGAVTLAYGLQFQDEIAGLIVLAPVSHEWPGGVAWYNQVSGWPVAGHILRRVILPIYGPARAQKGLPASFAPRTPPENYYEESGTGLLFRPKDFANNAADIRHLKSEIIKMQTRYGALTKPMAILAGENDVTVSPTIHATQLAKDVDHAVFELLPETGHPLHHAHQAKIIDAINNLTSPS